jgi:catechol 2,3-dioxygenase-like lactoylglutathione lyase family enzyme
MPKKRIRRPRRTKRRPERKRSPKRGAAPRAKRRARTSAKRPSNRAAVTRKRPERAKLAQIARSEAKPSEAQKDWQIESIFHFTVNATNFERSLAFYQAIGFQLLRDNRDAIWPAYVAENFGMTRAQGRGALLAIDAGPQHARLDLIEWLEPAYDLPPDKPWSERVPRIIALRTRNVRRAYRELSAKGIEFITPPRSMDPNSGIVGVMLCRDPDGLLVEFIEYEPGLLGSRVGHLAKRS